MIRVLVSADDFDAGAESVALGLSAGAVSTFVGFVRDDGGLKALRLDHYPGMTHNQLVQLAEQAAARWPLTGVTIIHRVGELPVGAQIVFVGTASAHRAAALESCAFLIDRLKTDATFWKKQIFSDGSESWVEARPSDDAAAARWDNP